MKRKHVITKVVALLLAVMMLMTACGSNTTTDAPASTNTAPATSTTPNASSTATGTDATSSTPSRDTINLAINQVAVTLNAWETTSAIDYQIHYQTYEGMFFVLDNGELEPRVCKDYTIGDDGCTYTVTLNDNVKFHNGKDVTAEDVAWSLNYMARDGEFLARRGTISDFKDAKVIDDKHVEITTTKKSSLFFASLCFNCAIYCKDEFLAAKEAGTLGVEWVPMGTGPYVITEYNPDTMIRMEAFPDYYRGEARIKKINYQVLLDNNSTAIAFESGDLDFITVPTASWAGISSNSDYTTFLAPTTHVSYFVVNTNTDGPLSNKLVRQALAYGTDREAMVAVAYDNLATVATSTFNPSSVFGGFTAEELEANGIPTYEYNPEKAKALLAEAGYPNGVDIGSILCINSSYWEKMSTVFQDNMKDIGVTVGIELADSAACRSRRAEGDFDLATSGASATIEASDFERLLKNVTPEMMTAGDTTDFNVHNDKLGELWEKSRTTMDYDARRDVYIELNRELNDQLYMLFTFHKATPYAYNKDLVCDQITVNYYSVYDFHWN